MGPEGIRLSFDLVTLMQLNLVRRRMTTMAYGEAFVHPDDVMALVEILNEWLPTEADIHSLYKGRSNGTNSTQGRAPRRTTPEEDLGTQDDHRREPGGRRHGA